MEVWKDVKGYEGLYQVSDQGNVKSLARKRTGKPWYKERILKPLDRKGYLAVSLYADGKCKLYSVHRLVADAFVPNKEGKQQINHKDGDKTNNKMSNLEWVTPSENILHSFDCLGKKAHTRKVLCVETGEVFESLKAVTEKTGIAYNHIPCCCKGRRNTVGGYHWQYV